MTIAALPQPKRRPVYAGPPFCYDNSAKAKEWLDDLKAKDPERSADEITRDYERGEEWCRPPGAPPPYDPKDPFSKMDTELNAARREIFVEHRASGGQPSVWYQYETNGVLFRFIRDSNGVTREKANPNLFGKWTTRGG